MTDDLEIRLIDTITQYLNNSGDLPQHSTVIYTRPVVVLPEDCPLMCVWLLAKEAAPRTTDEDDALISIGISWQIEAVARAETLRESPERSREALGATLTIQRLMRALFQHGWAQVASQDIPEAYDGWVANADYTPPTSLETGLVEGYALTVRVMVLENRS